MNSNSEHLRSSYYMQCCLFRLTLLKVETTKQNTDSGIQDQQNALLPSLVKQFAVSQCHEFPLNNSAHLDTVRKKNIKHLPSIAIRFVLASSASVFWWQLASGTKSCAKSNVFFCIQHMELFCWIPLCSVLLVTLLSNLGAGQPSTASHCCEYQDVISATKKSEWFASWWNGF